MSCTACFILKDSSATLNTESLDLPEITSSMALMTSFASGSPLIWGMIQLEVIAFNPIEIYDIQPHYLGDIW